MAEAVRMISRRSFSVVLPLVLASPAAVAGTGPGGFAGFLAGVRAEARQRGISPLRAVLWRRHDNDRG